MSAESAAGDFWPINLVSCPGNSPSTESAAAARPLGATTANTGEYLREEQRRGRIAAALSVLGEFPGQDTSAHPVRARQRTVPRRTAPHPTPRTPATSAPRRE